MTPSTLTLVLLAVALLLGVAAGRAKGRFTLLVVGLAVIAGGSWLVALLSQRVDVGAPPDVAAAQLGELYAVAVPLLVAFLAGWLAGRGTWLRRLVVLGVATLAVAALPYTELGRATAGLVTG